VTGAYLVEYPEGDGVLLVAGNRNPPSNGILNTIYYLRDCSSAWYVFNTTLATARYGHVAQWLPCSSFNC
jgi:hypothetical protein